ncbi:helix-turn-helix domain-containing protein [Streptomyces parvulus]|uniref:XRE family transcriptional regulator n=1 Tax=Streptomyces parvulus TaxID=146923 RepID=A0A369UXD8_9ACTN|nr:helix-turn-helix transcriptional regulator [Streptomyces parvulus]RDD85161.1 XRE family transcriptional regulator [Streptomyces parvulus]
MDDRRANVLGDYLRARRELLRPADVGLSDSTRRRVPGLRREEVATLSGISVDYYLGLEQGRDRRPSAEILQALAEALRLDDSATAHLFVLAGLVPRSRRRTPRGASATLTRLIESWPMTPAFVQTNAFLVLAANPLARALSPVHAPGTNIIRTLFLEPDSLSFEPDPRPDFVACLRELAGSDLADPDLTALVGELSARSEAFRRLWAQHVVGGSTNGRVRVAHPRVGTLTLDFERFSIPSAPEQQLVVYSAESGGTSYDALRRLAEWDG